MAADSRQQVHTTIAAVVLFGLSLFLSAYSAKRPALARSAAAAVAEVVHPVTSVVAGAIQAASDAVSSLALMRKAVEENARLSAMLQRYEGMAVEVEEEKRENRELRDILGMLQRPGRQGVVASLIGITPSQWVEGIVIGRGASDGIRVGLAVITPKGVVGQVVAVGRSSSRVLLLTDRVSGIDTLIQSSRVRGVVTGLGGHRCAMRYVLRREQVVVGERVITSGLDGVYPRGLPVGTVARVDKGGAGLFQEIEVAPAVDVTRLEHVVVLRDSAPAWDDEASDVQR